MVRMWQVSQSSRGRQRVLARAQCITRPIAPCLTLLIRLLAHAGCTTLLEVGNLGLLLRDTLVENLGVLVLSVMLVTVWVEDEAYPRLTAASLEASARRRLSATLWRLCWRR